MIKTRRAAVAANRRASRIQYEGTYWGAVRTRFFSATWAIRLRACGSSRTSPTARSNPEEVKRAKSVSRWSIWRQVAQSSKWRRRDAVSDGERAPSRYSYRFSWALLHVIPFLLFLSGQKGSFLAGVILHLIDSVVQPGLHGAF